MAARCSRFPGLVVIVLLVLVTAWTPAISAPAAPVGDGRDRSALASNLSAYPWLYLRDGQPLAAGERTVEILATGDVMPGRGVAGEPQPLAAVIPLLQGAGLALGNLECVVARSGSVRPGPYRLRAPLSAAEDLRQAGFDLLGLANNHALDFGPAALAETVSRLCQVGLAVVGVGPDPKAAAQPVIRDVGGLRVAFLAFNAVPDPDGDCGGWTPSRWDEAQATAAVSAARSQAAAIIVSIHWGYEYEQTTDPFQRRVAQALIDAGADLVVGHHPHVVQGTEVVSTPGQARDGFVAYSLGNLLFDQQQGEQRQGLVLRAFFDRDGLRSVQAVPVWAGPRPQLMTAGDARPLLARVAPLERRVGFACQPAAGAGGGLDCNPVDVPQARAGGRFATGQIDLTGDGQPEQIQIEGEQVVVYRDGVEAWRGLPEWRVVDLALGDANDDGRGEMLLALWKASADGVPQSHPFLIGYREGSYRILWGGSAVAEPLQEVEVGDVDGDGIQELIAVEEQGSRQTLAVWRWHGWGFSLEWRSSPGHYRNLALLPQPGAAFLITAGVMPN